MFYLSFSVGHKTTPISLTIIAPFTTTATTTTPPPTTTTTTTTPPPTTTPTIPTPPPWPTTTVTTTTPPPTITTTTTTTPPPTTTAHRCDDTLNQLVQITATAENGETNGVDTFKPMSAAFATGIMKSNKGIIC